MLKIASIKNNFFGFNLIRSLMEFSMKSSILKHHKIFNAIIGFNTICQD